MEKKENGNKELKQEEMDQANGGSGYTRSLAKGLRRRVKRQIVVSDDLTKDAEDDGRSGGATGGW